MFDFETNCLSAKDIYKDREAIQLAANFIQRGEVVAFPTETVYGLGADATNPKAVEKIFLAKGRPQDNPLIVHVHSLEQINSLVDDFPTKAQQLADAFWPGPLTIILPRSQAIPACVSAGLDTVAVRFPLHPIARELISLAGKPIAAPSANRSSSPSPTTAQHCMHDLQGRIPLVLNGGETAVGLESTVVTLCTPIPRLLRPGAVTLEELQEVIGTVELDDAVLHQLSDTQVPSSPGMKYKHYAPVGKATLVHGNREQYRDFLEDKQQPDSWAMCFVEDKNLPIPCVTYGHTGNELEQAQSIFSVLRRLDESGAKNIWIHAPKAEGIGLAVYNRLLRSCGFDEIYLEGV